MPAIPAELTRYLRQDNGDIWIWNEIMAKRLDMVEVYARNVEDAKKALPVTAHEQITEVQLGEMTKAMLIGYAWDRFMIRLDPALKHEDMVMLLKEHINRSRQEAGAAYVVEKAVDADQPTPG